MRLYRLKLRPTSPWRTPWQSDTLAGLLCWTCARTLGEPALRGRILEPALAGQPPFLLSDAFPGDLLPLPLALRLAPCPPDRQKGLKHARWLSPADFRIAREGDLPDPNALLADSAVFHLESHTHNTLARDTNATGLDASLFARPDNILAPRNGQPPRLTLYFRAQPDAADLLLELLSELVLTGFGADVATGRGQFQLGGDPEPADDLDEPPPDANAVIALSTFQPAANDPVIGYWETFTKYGKLGPGLGLDNPSVSKNPLVMFRPGSCFAAARPFLGRAIPMDELLPAPVAAILRQRGVEIIHWAYALTVPATLKFSQESPHV